MSEIGQEDLQNKEGDIHSPAEIVDENTEKDKNANGNGDGDGKTEIEQSLPEIEKPDPIDIFNNSIVKAQLRSVDDQENLDKKQEQATKDKNIIPLELKDENIGPMITKESSKDKADLTQIKKQDEMLKKIRNAFEDLNQFTAFFDCEVQCNQNERHMFKPVKWTDLEEEEKPKNCCNTCGEFNTCSGLGFFKCNVEEDNFLVCTECLLQGKHPNNIPIDKKFNVYQQKLKLCKDYLTKCSDTHTKWICHSVYMKGVQDIPTDWAKCETGINETLSVKDYNEQSFHKIPKYKSVNSEFQVCLKCLHKWKNFEYNQEKDYTEYKIEKTPEELKKLQYKEVKIGVNKTQSRQHGEDLYHYLCKSYITGILKQKISTSEIDVFGYMPVKEDFETTELVFHPSMKFGEVERADIKSKDVQFVRTPSEYFPVVRTYEQLKLKNNDQDFFLKTLRIYDDEKNYSHIRTIVLETLPKQINAVEPMATYLHFRDCIYYFKRIYIKEDKQEDPKTNNEKKEEEKQSVNEGIDDDENKDEEVDKKEEYLIKNQKSYLQLYRYKLTNNKETIVKDFVFWEKDYYLCPMLNKNFGEKYIIFSDEEVINKMQYCDLKKAKAICLKMYQDIYAWSIVININLMECVFSIGDYLQRQYDQAITEGFMVDRSFINGDPSNDEFQHPKEEGSFSPSIKEIDEQFLKRQYCLIQRYSNQNEGQDSEDDESEDEEEKKIDQENALEELVPLPGEQPTEENPEENDKKEERVEGEGEEGKEGEEGEEREEGEEGEIAIVEEVKKVKKIRRDYKKSFKIFQMNEVNKPVACFSIRNANKEYSIQCIGNFFKTLDVTTTEFYEENDFPDLAMFRNQTYIQKDKSVKKKKVFEDDLIKLRAVFLFQDDQKYKYALNLNEDEMETDTARKNLIRYQVSSQYPDCSKQVQSVKIDTIKLPGQQFECSYTQYVLFDYSYGKYILLYPVFNKDEYVEEEKEETGETGDGKDASNAPKKNKQTYNDYIISLISNKVQMANSSIQAINVSSNSFNSNIPITFRRTHEITDMIDDILGLQLPIGIDQETHLNLLEGQCKHSLFLWRPNSNIVSIINFLEDHIFTKPQNSSKNELKFWPQKVNTEYMDQFPGGNPNVSNTQKFLTKATMGFDGTIYLNSKYQNVINKFSIVEYSPGLDENGSFQLESFPNENEGMYVIIESLEVPGTYEYLQIKNFDHQVLKKDEKGEDGKDKKVIEEMQNNTSFVFKQRCDDHYLFVFRINECYVFVKKDIPLECNKKIPIMDLNTQVQVMKKIKNNKITFDIMSIRAFFKIKPAKTKKYMNIFLNFEKVIDNACRESYVAMIYKENKYEAQFNAQNITLVFLDINNFTTVETSIQPQVLNNEDVRSDFFKIQRTSKRLPIGKKTELFEHYDSIFTIGYLVQNQGNRYEFYDISFSEKITFNEKQEQQKVVSSTKFIGRKMIIASTQEQMINSPYNFYLLPLYCLNANHILGVLFIKEGSQDIMIPMHRSKHNEKMNIKVQRKLSFSGITGSFKKLQLHQTDKEKKEKEKEKEKQKEKILVNQAIYKYKIKKMMKFDIKKAFVVNKEGNQERYFLLVNVQLERSFAYGPMFDNFELHYLLHETTRSLLSMVPFTFKNMLFDGLKVDMKQQSFFKKLEVLNGQTLSDLFLKDPVIISKALKQSTEEIETHTFIEEIYSDQKLEFIERAVKAGFFSIGQSFLQSDFCQVNQLMRAYDQKATKSANLLIEHIFSLSNKNVYQNEIMKCLNQILEQKKIGNGLIQFFGQADELASSNELCNLEMKILNSQAPLFSKKDWNVLKIYTIDNFQNYEQEIIDKMLEEISKDDKKEGNMIEEEEEEDKTDEEKKKEAKAKQLVKEKAEEDEEEKEDTHQNLFDINNTLIDFRYLIIGQKLQNFKSDTHEQYTFDDYALSEMISNMTSNDLIFTQTSVKRLIDHQFEDTKIAMEIKFLIFLILYYIPFLVVCFLQQNQSEALIMALSFMTQCYFFFIEIVQMQQKGIISYVKEGFWNFVEYTQFAVFIALFIYRAIEVFKQDESVVVIILQLYLIVVGFIKILFFIRIYEDYGFLVQMVGNTMIQLIPFIVFFFMWVIFFGLLYWILRVEIDSADEDYLNLTDFFRYFFMTYRNSIGDITAPGYVKWNKTYSDDIPSQLAAKTFVIFLIWVVWLVNQILNLIILLNFLIAVISQVYDNVVAEQKTLSYKHRADLNKEHYMLQKFLGKLKDFKILIFQIDKEVMEAEDDQFVGFVQTLKNYISKQNKDLINKVGQVNTDLTVQIQDDSNLTKSTLKVITETVNNLTKDNQKIIMMLKASATKDSALQKMLVDQASPLQKYKTLAPNTSSLLEL